MRYTYSILQVSNAFDPRIGVTYFSTVIRMGTCSEWNHTAILEYRDGVPHRVIESVGAGVIATPYPAWFGLTNRRVREKPVIGELDSDDIVYVMSSIGNMGYGVLDILQLARYIVMSKWLATDYEWNGVRGTGAWKGVTCSELVGILLGDEKPWLAFPSTYDHHPKLGAGVEWRTRKGLKISFIPVAA